jgi:sigma-B regulation protein RsbU (phosphoserine phosphatase)
MWTFIFFSLFLGTLVALAVVMAAFTRKLAEVEKERSDLEVEETRVFDFLHGLGEAFSEGVRPADLHRLIVEGAVRILEAHGGALYLVDKADQSLVPAFISTGYPPLIDLPPHLLEQMETTPQALESYVRLHSVRKGEGVLGAAWEQGQVLVLQDEDLIFPDNRPGEIEVKSAMVGPLEYRRKTLGVLALANGPMSSPFRRDEVSVFKTITEQSAFALYNEAIYLQAGEKKRLDQDLRMAREIQSILLPAGSPDFSGYDIDGVNVPAYQVSGDYFDFIPMGPDHLGVVIADVSGKGVAASLIMAMCRSVIRSQAGLSISPAEILRNVNRLLYPDIKEDMFISMAMLVLQRDSGEALLARAGHDPPFCYRSSGRKVENLSPRGMAMGIDSGDVFDRILEDAVIRLETGDTLVFYTDGATEAMDLSGLEFGLPRLIKSVQAEVGRTAGTMVREISRELTGFIGEQRQYDDITLIAVQKT